MSNNNNTNTNWTNANFQGQGIPEPAGTDANGNPFWIVNDQKVSWQQMQQYLFQQRQASAPASSGGGFEGIPNMPVANFEIPSNPETRVESAPNPERRLERSENNIETGVERHNQQGNQPQQTSKQPKVEPDTVFGDSVKLENVKINDTDSLHNYYQTTKSQANDPKKSGSYLNALVKKILMQMLFFRS